jgi:nanoRNase/pAp phosphatase (c-di-AMP/oligoRNAs hydrolase)
MVQTGYKSLGKCALIDHHTPGDLSEACEIGLAKIGSSTAELVYHMYKQNGLPVDANVAFALVLAIITDTGHFRYAGAGTFEAVGHILAEGGIRYADVMDFLGHVPVDLSCRIAILKAASRLTLHRVGDLLIVESRVSSFGSQAATSLVNLGADIAFVGSEKDRERRISGRVRRGVDLDLARLLQEVGKKYGKTGAQAVLRWHLQNGVAIIPKSVKKNRITENADIFDFDLSAEDMSFIDGLNRNRPFGSDPDKMTFGF